MAILKVGMCTGPVCSSSLYSNPGLSSFKARQGFFRGWKALLLFFFFFPLFENNSGKCILGTGKKQFFKELWIKSLTERCTCFWLHCVQEWLQGVPAIRQFYRLLLCFAAKALNHKSINNSKFSSQRQPTKISSDGKGGKCHCIFPEFSCLRSIWIWQEVQSGEKAAQMLREKLVILMSDTMQEELCIEF